MFIRRFFARGLIAVLPLVLTATVLYLVVHALYIHVGVPIGEALQWAVSRLAGDWAEAHRESWFFNQGAPLLGFAAALLLTLSAGFLVATFFGRTLFGWLERILKRTPVIGVVYPYARQIADFFFSDEKKVDFKTAVAVPFPSRGVWSIGFVTGGGLPDLDRAAGKSLVCVFVPNSPTPISGWVVYVPREDVVPLPLSVEQAMRIIITAGVVHPEPPPPPAPPAA
jgi:uncharacterized membrane protein